MMKSLRPGQGKAIRPSGGLQAVGTPGHSFTQSLMDPLTENRDCEMGWLRSDGGAALSVHSVKTSAGCSRMLNRPPSLPIGPLTSDTTAGWHGASVGADRIPKAFLPQ